MRGNHRIPLLAAGEVLHAGALQLHPHQHRQRPAHQSAAQGEDQVERADVLVVGAEQPAGDEPGRVPVMVGMATWSRVVTLMSAFPSRAGRSLRRRGKATRGSAGAASDDVVRPASPRRRTPRGSAP